MLIRAHPAISHCSHLLQKSESGYKSNSLAKGMFLPKLLVATRFTNLQKYIQIEAS